MREEERKYSVPAGAPDPRQLLATLGEATGLHTTELPVRVLRAVYWDTDDLRLAAAGVTIRHRTGEDAPPWQVKVPLGDDAREEVACTGPEDYPPPAATALLTAWARGKALGPVAELVTRRNTLEVRATGEPGSATGPVLAEVVADQVTVHADGGRRVFQEIEVERRDGGADLLDTIEAALASHGARRAELVPKLVAALGARLPHPPEPVSLSPDSPAAEVIGAALNATVARLQRHDPLVRRRADDAVHQMRVCCRRLRSDLRTFRPLLDRPWTSWLRAELAWLAGALGEARDAEVLHARLRRTAVVDPLAPLSAAAIDMIETDLVEKEASALAALDEVLTGHRYVLLLDALVDAAQRPRLRPAVDASRTAGGASAGAAPAGVVLPPLVRREWRRLAERAAQLDENDPVAAWHQARITAKRARYAAEAAAPALGRPAKRLGKAIAAVQDVLGEHQDAAVAAGVWHEVAERHAADTELVLTCGRLVEREWAAVRSSRAGFDQVWHAASAPELSRWLGR